MSTEISASAPGMISLTAGFDIHDRGQKGSELIVAPRFATSLRAEGREALVSFSAECFTTYKPAAGRFGACLRIVPDGGKLETGEDRFVREGNCRSR